MQQQQSIQSNKLKLVMTPISNAHFHAFDETDEVGMADNEG